MKLIDGKAVAEELKNSMKQDVLEFKKKSGRVPHLAAILVGNNPASKAYVGNKVKSCEQVGFKSTLIKLDEDVAEEILLQEIQKLNEDPDIDGFIVQLPLPKHIDEVKVTLSIDFKKDVDGFHPVNFGRMAQGLPCYLPATPYGITLLLDRYNIETAGKHVVVVGRSNIVGTPMSILLSRKSKVGDATVTLTHSRTKNLQRILLQADIIIAAIGIPGFIKEDMVRQGAVVIDVGINRVEDERLEKGSRLVGDVDFEFVKEKCSFITPVPGGVGPMTVMGLMMNTFKSATKEIYP
ncbi:MAG: bifunctional 5,10-methylene-tetrahydrofolate dehydrogenase/5,10-methylene-tetrahydrofolate cyclohydrolase [Saprospiraceae bacterium]|jgi:methylenetetrahydrofolate dehydrogenase (NADP+)/methenyltetrahydrofolate cyclohydrolase|nr:bifunctional 5,10-methylene-tetrahydrofolate dehydrogenase/5,10-methylene-tetrahydrofolate cyclohydrolase [Saprospiraceae bacterium]MBP6569375.1 bifunctional 5,10-methylene-tetrahydrofolate dehydrogenase/5,10-methylene-tetrahydrofolate cyclohydrolase [Saprospiraceae bacterium]MBP9196749.1 bifunctional 5,10-methylene-tetrahydrofolate dehydrogenase/5,10-methylene-tetrahydrofolate cyclohydrolase [Saprospiraceae bacterium]